MTTANQTSQPIPNLLMTAITIELQGAALVSTQEDVDHISRDTDQRVLRFTWEADGSIEAWLGNSRLNVAGNCTRLTHGLYKHPMEAENDIRHCCHLMAMILEKAQHAVGMLVIRVQAMATARPELARSVEGIELESNDLAPATSTGGERFPVWHRLTSNHDTTAREFFDFYFNYDATAAVVTEHNPSEEFMVDVALTLMDEMDRRTSRANTGDKVMTLVASALAGGDCIDDADVLRTGGTASAIGCVVKAPSTLGTFLRSFRWGHVRQLDRVSRELLARAWAAGAGTGDVLMSRLREGRANTARGAAHFLRETVGRVRYGGARGQLTVRADSGFYTHALVAVCREMDVRYSITIRQHKSLHNLIEAIPEEDWTPILYWMDGAAAVAETTYTPFQSEPDAAPVRLIVRRVKPTPGTQLALFASYRYHGCITDREGETLALEADHRRHAEIENAIRDLKYGVGLNHLPSGRFATNAAWLAVQVMAHNLARWTARLGLGEQVLTTKTLRRRFFSLAGRLTHSARRLTLYLPQRWPWENQFSRALARLRALPFPA